MSISWYNTFTFFGYEIIIPENTTYRKFCKGLYGINSIISPFEITGILSDFHNQLDSSDPEELVCFDEQSYLVIGFKPPNNLDELLKLSKELSDYVIDNPFLESLTYSVKPRFFSGIEWFETLDDESDDDYNDSSTEGEQGEGEGEEDEDKSEEDSMEEEDDESLGIQEYKK